MSRRHAPVTARFKRAADAVVSGDIDALAALLEEDPSLVLQRSSNRHGATLLHYTAAAGVEDRRLQTPPNGVAVAHLLLQKGAKADSLCDIYGGGPSSTTLCLVVTSFLLYAAGRQDALIRVLVEAGAQVDGIDDDGLPLASALHYLYPEAGRTLVSIGARSDQLLPTAAYGTPAQLTTCLDAPTTMWPFNADTDDHLAFALSLAGLTGNLANIRLLTQRGVSMDAPGLHGATALHLACYANHQKTVRYLLKQGADPNRRDQTWSKHAQEWALAGSNLALALSMAQWVSLSIWEAVAWDARSCIEDLLAESPDLARAWDEAGYQPIHYLASPLHNEKQILRLLLENGADLNSPTRESGQTLLDLAQTSQSESFLQHLLRLGARSGTLETHTP